MHDNFLSYLTIKVTYSGNLDKRINMFTYTKMSLRRLLNRCLNQQ